MAALPIIDPSPYLYNDARADEQSRRRDREQTAQALHNACRDIGFFYLKVDGYLTHEEMDEVLELGREFFHRPQDEKERIRLERSDGVRGYQRLKQNVTQGKADHHEGLDFYAPSPFQDTSGNEAGPTSDSGAMYKPLAGPNQWPEQPKPFKAKLEVWIDKMKILGMAVMRGMADGLGMSNDEWAELKGKVNDSFWVMRVIGYPPLPDGADGISCGEHKDYGCLTLLHCDPIPNSLQVLAPYPTPHWVNADPIPGCIVVNIGEMWDIWTGGLYPATLHRVIHKSPKYRVSIPFFFEPNFDARVRLLEASKRKVMEEGRDLVKGAEDAETVYGDFLLNKVSGNFKY
ncbi:hypothetical protein IAU60_004859 [Kwoniella sp. DSM 27419]